MESFEEESQEQEMEGTYIDENEMDEVPYVGMIFDSQMEVGDYYIKYAQQAGFGIAKTSNRLGDDGEVKYFALGCSQSGNIKRTAKNHNPLKPRLSTKTNCQAMIRSTLQNDGRFKLTTVVLERNRELSPGKAHHFRNSKNMDTHVKRRLELHDRVGISVAKNFNALVVEAGGFENLTFNEKDYQNYIEKARMIRLGEGDAETLFKYFRRAQSKNFSFYYAIDLDEDNRIRNLC